MNVKKKVIDVKIFFTSITTWILIQDILKSKFLLALSSPRHVRASLLSECYSLCFQTVLGASDNPEMKKDEL